MELWKSALWIIPFSLDPSSRSSLSCLNVLCYPLIYWRGARSTRSASLRRIFKCALLSLVFDPFGAQTRGKRRHVLTRVRLVMFDILRSDTARVKSGWAELQQTTNCWQRSFSHLMNPWLPETGAPRARRSSRDACPQRKSLIILFFSKQQAEKVKTTQVAPSNTGYSCISTLVTTATAPLADTSCSAVCAQQQRRSGGRGPQVAYLSKPDRKSRPCRPVPLNRNSAAIPRTVRTPTRRQSSCDCPCTVRDNERPIYKHPNMPKIVGIVLCIPKMWQREGVERELEADISLSLNTPHCIVCSRKSWKIYEFVL